jgi:uncharacterized protein (TIGR02594 family)
MPERRVNPTAEQLSIAPWMRYARAQLGVREVDGDGDNPQIVEWIKACAPGRPWLAHDSTPHCSAFVNACMLSVGISRTRSLAARSWLRYGDAIPLDEARYGDVVVLWRGVYAPAAIINAPGHVTFFVGWVDGAHSMLRGHGANQQNRVSILPYARRRVLRVCRPLATELQLHDLMRGDD